MCLKTSMKISITIHNDITSFMPVPTKNERNEPTPLFKALSLLLLSCNSSPIIAPMNGATITPIGPAKTPTNAPIIAPLSPAFEPPNFFVIYDGKR